MLKLALLPLVVLWGLCPSVCFPVSVSLKIWRIGCSTAASVLCATLLTRFTTLPQVVAQDIVQTGEQELAGEVDITAVFNPGLDLRVFDRIPGAHTPQLTASRSPGRVVDATAVDAEEARPTT
jgi:hypothetical protein